MQGKVQFMPWKIPSVLIFVQKILNHFTNSEVPHIKCIKIAGSWDSVTVRNLHPVLAFLTFLLLNIFVFCGFHS